MSTPNRKLLMYSFGRVLLDRTADEPRTEAAFQAWKDATDAFQAQEADGRSAYDQAITIPHQRRAQAYEEHTSRLHGLRQTWKRAHGSDRMNALQDWIRAMDRPPALLEPLPTVYTMLGMREAAAGAPT